MIAREVLEAARVATPVERLRRYESICRSRGACRQEPLENDPGHWTWCPDCLTIYDDYGKAVNQISEFR
jgi:hypothetical protein